MAPGQRLNPGQGREGPLSQSHLKQHLTLRAAVSRLSVQPTLGRLTYKDSRAPGSLLPPAGAKLGPRASQEKGLPLPAPPRPPGVSWVPAEGGPSSPCSSSISTPSAQAQGHRRLCSEKGAVGRAARALAASARPADREGAPAPSNGLARVPRSGLKTRSTGPPGAAPGGDSAPQGPGSSRERLAALPRLGAPSS